MRAGGNKDVLDNNPPKKEGIGGMLTNEQIQHFDQEGYLVFESLIQGEKLEGYMAIFDELVKRGRSLPVDTPHWNFEIGADQTPIPGLLHKIQGVCVVEPQILSLAGEPAILDRVETLSGPNIDVFGTKFFPKLPKIGTSVRWHQDNFYFGTNSKRIVSCAIYLEDANRENGCLRIVPKSHLSQTIAAHEKDPFTYGSWAEVDESEAIDLELRGGTVVLFSANLLHGAYDNRSNRTRFGTAWHYVPGDLELERFPRGEYEDRHILRGH